MSWLIISPLSRKEIKPIVDLIRREAEGESSATREIRRIITKLERAAKAANIDWTISWSMFFYEQGLRYRLGIEQNPRRLGHPQAVSLYRDLTESERHEAVLQFVMGLLRREPRALTTFRDKVESLQPAIPVKIDRIPLQIINGFVRGMRLDRLLPGGCDPNRSKAAVFRFVRRRYQCTSSRAIKGPRTFQWRLENPNEDFLEALFPLRFALVDKLSRRYCRDCLGRLLDRYRKRGRVKFATWLLATQPNVAFDDLMQTVVGADRLMIHDFAKRNNLIPSGWNGLHGND